VPFVVIVCIALAIGVINIHPPVVLFAMFVMYGLSGYVLYAWRKAKENDPTLEYRLSFVEYKKLYRKNKI
jgi:hypothetical protein